ncbi:MAG: hypothetical protein ACOVQK_03240, partial [Cyanobium sp.]
MLLLGILLSLKEDSPVKNDQSTGHQSQAGINRPKGVAGKENGWNWLNPWVETTWRTARKTDQENAVAAWDASRNKPVIRTNKADYAPGETVDLQATGFAVGSTVRFSLADDPNRPGVDGKADVYGAFLVRDGGPGDLDGQPNGAVSTRWNVPNGPGIPSALGATVNLVAQDVKAGRDRIYGTADDGVGVSASTSFRDGPSGLVTTGVGATIDETKGNQNAATGGYAGDLDDNDITIDMESTDPNTPDFPAVFRDRLISLTANPSTSIGSALSGYDGINSGLEIFTTGGSAAVSFVGVDGKPLVAFDSKL